MPLDDSFKLTQITIDFADGPRTRARLYMDPDDVYGRGIDATFLNVERVVDMTDATVLLWWQHDQAPALRGLEPFEPVDASVGHFKVHYPSAMGQSAGTVSAKIVVKEGESTVAVPLRGIEVPGDAIDPSATPSEDTFSVLARLLEMLEDGIVDVEDATRAATDAAGRADAAARDASSAAEDANQAASEAWEAAEGAARADAAADRAEDAAQRAETGEDARERAESERVAAEEDRAERFETAQSERDEAFRDAEAGRDARIQGAVRNAETATAEANRAASDADEYMAGVRASVEAGEFDGATFTPSVSAEGLLSWTNDRSLPNPQSVSVRGPKGERGETGAGLEVLDSYATYEEMVGEHPEGSAPGEAYMVGTHYWTWNGSEWVDCGELRGARGDPGEPAGWGDVTATVDGSTGTPKVEVTATGPDTARALDFAFTGLKGPQGDQGPAGTSVTHEWDGSTLKVTSASGTSSADLMGPRGPAGENATTTELSSEEAAGLLRQLSGRDDQVLLGTGEWGEYRGGGGSSGPLWLEVDDTGDLYAYYDDGSGEPNLEYEEGTGNLYAIFETEG